METSFRSSGILYQQISSALVKLALNSKSLPNNSQQTNFDCLQSKSETCHFKMNDFVSQLNGACMGGSYHQQGLQQSPMFSSLAGNFPNFAAGQNLGQASALNELLRLIQASNQVAAVQPLQQQASREKIKESNSYSTTSSASCLSELLFNEGSTSVKSSSMVPWGEMPSQPRVFQPQTVQFSGSQRVLSQESYSTESKPIRTGSPNCGSHSAGDYTSEVNTGSTDNENLNFLFSDILDGCDFGFGDNAQELDVSKKVEPVSNESADFCGDLKLVDATETCIFDELDLQNVELLPSLDVDWGNKESEESQNLVFKVSNFEDLFSVFPLSEPQITSSESPSLSSDVSNDVSLVKERKEEDNDSSDVKSSNTCVTLPPVQAPKVEKLNTDFNRKRKADCEAENYSTLPYKREEHIVVKKTECGALKESSSFQASDSTTQLPLSRAIQNVDVSYPPRRTRRRSEVTTSRAMASRMRRDKISNRLRTLYSLVPNGKSWDTASMLDETIAYVKYLRSQADEEDC